MSERDQQIQRQKGAYGSGTVFFMIVSFPADAADTICCSMDLVTLALSACDVGRRMWGRRKKAWGVRYLAHVGFFDESWFFGWFVSPPLLWG